MSVPKKNIFEYDGEEFNKKLDEIFSNTDKKELKQILIECGLETKERNTIEKTADEMFEELGYEKHSSKSHERFDLYSSDYEHLIRIVFNLRTKRIAIHCDNDALGIQELQAINKKVEEWRWIK